MVEVEAVTPSPPLLLGVACGDEGARAGLPCLGDADVEGGAAVAGGLDLGDVVWAEIDGEVAEVEQLKLRWRRRQLGGRGLGSGKGARKKGSSAVARELGGGERARWWG
uniref:DUF834 domain-containing protein n=1 Tax=Oryza glumipatula TaxID=40148 RepID=A0A0D9ZBY1_9ORYZ